MNSRFKAASTLVATWNYEQLATAFLVAVMFQSVLLPCLCDIGTAKVFFAYALDGVAFLRVIIALLCRETGNGWQVYAGLLLSSPAWVEGIAYLVFGGH